MATFHQPIVTIRFNRAQGMIEFALALPIVLLLIFGVVELGRLLVTLSAVYTASHEAARYGATNGISGTGLPYSRDCAGMIAAAVRTVRAAAPIPAA